MMHSVCKGAEGGGPPLLIIMMLAYSVLFRQNEPHPADRGGNQRGGVFHVLGQMRHAVQPPVDQQHGKPVHVSPGGGHLDGAQIEPGRRR